MNAPDNPRLPSKLASRRRPYASSHWLLGWVVLWVSYGLGPGLFPAFAQLSPAPGTIITNQAVGSFKGENAAAADAPAMVESNTVSVTVSEVAGISVDNDSRAPLEAASSVTDAGVAQGNGVINPDDIVYFTFRLSNIGNDPTQFFIPGTPASISNGSFNSTDNPIRIIGYDVDGEGTTAANTGLSINVPETGDLTSNLSITDLASGSFEANGYVLVQVPIKALSTLNDRDTVTVIYGDTGSNDNGATTQNQEYSASGMTPPSGVSGFGGYDIYTHDNSGTANGDTNGTPVNGDASTHRQEASYWQTVTVNINDDFGDAPDSYGNAYHRMASSPILYLGSEPPDGELESLNATNGGSDGNGDDNTNTPDDEDGIALVTLTQGDTEYTLPITNLSVEGTGVLHAWIDFDQSGAFEADEHQSVSVSDGTILTPLEWTGLSVMTSGTTYGRFRLTSDTLTHSGGLTDPDERAIGAASDGEVEDYLIAIAPPSYSLAGTLYQNNDGDNNYDPGTDATLPDGITLNLIDPTDDSVIASTTTTGGNGGYTFSNIPVRDASSSDGYLIQVDIDDADIPSGLSLRTGNFIEALLVDADLTGLDFGFDPPGACFAGDNTGVSSAGITEYISGEVGPGDTVANRNLVAEQDDQWRSDAGDIGLDTFFRWNDTRAGDINGTTLTQPHTLISSADGSDVTVTASNLDLANINDCSGLETTSWRLDDSTTLQGNAPRPTDLAGTSPLFWNQTGGSGSNRNAILFEFSEPVAAFGAWFGDLETRTDGKGTPAIMRLLDADGQRIGDDQLIAPEASVDQSTCGGTTALCGNATTRWVGFVDPSKQVSKVLIIVGDDDDSLGAGDITGNSERISFIGATIAIATPTTPSLLLVKRITSVDNAAINPNDSTDLSTFINDDTTASPTTDDDNAGWPDDFLIGAIDAGLVRPDDEVEYTIYFLSSGDATANGVVLCDRIPEHQTFVTDSFNSETQGAGGNSPEELGIMVLLDEPSVTGNETGLAYTNIADGDFARYYTASDVLPAACGTEPNERGAVVVDLGNLPHSTSQATPSNSYGYVRFRAKTD